MRSYSLEAIIIKRRNFLEKDRILTLFSRERGKTEALAKGARRPGNRLSANSDLATEALFYIHLSKSLDIITEIKSLFHPDGIRGKFDKTQKISYALKIIDNLFELDQPHPHSYHALQCLIKSVSKRERQLIFLKFLIEVLDDLGFLPNLSACPVCRKSINSNNEFVFAFQGGLTHKKCLDGNSMAIGASSAKLLRVIHQKRIEEVACLKTKKNIFEESFEIIAKYFNYEFGKILPDEVM